MGDFDFSVRSNRAQQFLPLILQQRQIQATEQRDDLRREDQALRDGLAFLRAGASTKDFEALLLDRGARPSTVQALRGLEPAIKKQRKLEEDIGTQATGFGALLQRTESGAADPRQLTRQLGSLLQEFGPEATQRISSLGQAQLQVGQAGEEAGARRAVISSQAIQARAEATRVAREDLKSLDPVVISKRREAEITLRILEGKRPTPRERSFLNERQRQDPLKAFTGNILREALETADITGDTPKDVEAEARRIFAIDPEMAGWTIVGKNPDGTLLVKPPPGQGTELMDYTPPPGL